jgi:hypothetical protein
MGISRPGEDWRLQAGKRLNLSKGGHPDPLTTDKQGADPQWHTQFVQSVKRWAKIDFKVDSEAGWPVGTRARRCRGPCGLYKSGRPCTNGAAYPAENVGGAGQ